jgi:TonB-dependent SusC/RagA subfamily outer membrane receptor
MNPFIPLIVINWLLSLPVNQVTPYTCYEQPNPRYGNSFPGPQIQVSDLYDQINGKLYLSRLPLPSLIREDLSKRNNNNELVLRCPSSLSTSVYPLIVVNDNVYEGEIEDINPDKIVSITILKDKAAISIYGVGGANGVICIKLKKVKKGRGKN